MSSGAPGDRAWGLRDYTIRDPYGHRLTFGHHIPASGPPIVIERVDVPVRLETRVASVLRDLAAHKGMSVSSCLEETLLHTFEPYGDGVASPHTRQDLRSHPGAQGKARHRLRRPRELPVRRKRVARRLEFAARYTDAWCSQDPSKVASVLTADGTLTSTSGPPAVGRAAIAGAAHGFMSAFPDLLVRHGPRGRRRRSRDVSLDAHRQPHRPRWNGPSPFVSVGASGGGSAAMVSSPNRSGRSTRQTTTSALRLGGRKERVAMQAHDDGAVPAEGSRPRVETRSTGDAQHRDRSPATAPRHPGWVRISHWILTASVLTLAASGWAILMVHPRLYWGQAGNDLTPALLELPISRNHRHGGWVDRTPLTSDPRGPISASRTYDIFNQNGWARSLHFSLHGGSFSLEPSTCSTGLGAGYFRARMWPARRELAPRHVWRDVLDHLRFKIPAIEANVAVRAVAEGRVHGGRLRRVAARRCERAGDVAGDHRRRAGPAACLRRLPVGADRALRCICRARAVRARARRHGRGVRVQAANAGDDDRRLT